MTYPYLLNVEIRRRLCVSFALLFASASSAAAEFEITVLDRNGEPVPNVAVYVQSDDDGDRPETEKIAVMQQVDSRFEPDLLVVQTGTRVQFPNNDIVAHHVYSFSTPNNFVLPMFRGGMRPQVQFEHPGVVTVGCNLHDQMVGYILVVDGQAYGKTDRDGRVHLDADNPEGVTVKIWSPDIRPEQENLAQTVRAGRSARLTFLLTEELRTQQSDDMETYSWRENRIR